MATEINIQTAGVSNKTWVLKDNFPVKPITGFNGTFNNLSSPNPLYVEINNVQLEKYATTKDYIEVGANTTLFLDSGISSDGYLNYVIADLIDRSGVVLTTSSGFIPAYSYISSTSIANRYIIGCNFTNVQGEYKIRIRAKNNNVAWKFKASIYNIWLEKGAEVF